ncbi:hypothetical protein WN943_015716 [Citrus x changshan-huyou]
MAHDRQNNVTKRKRGRPKTNRGNVDRISALPDSTAVPNLSFDDRLCLRPPASTYVPLRVFADFVHTVLLRTNPAKIGKFSLYCSRPTNLARFYDWIATALMREVGEIQLYLGQQSRVELPEAIYSAACLKVLTLDSDFSIQVPYSGTCFPSVKILSVRLENPEKSVTENIFCSCPSLEELSVTCELHDDTPPPNLIILSATLKTCKLIVDPYRAIQLLAGINSCKYLHLSAGIMSAVDHACDSCFPSFSQLNYIEMGVGPIGWRVLPIVLRSSPNLESLVLHKECWFQFTEEQFGWLESDFDVPHCLVHTVKNIEIKGVQGDEDERPLLKYLLQFAAAMEKMLMWAKASIPKENRANLRESILQLPRASMKTTIEIK